MDSTEQALAELPDWRLLSDALHTRFRTGTFAAGLALVDAIGALAEAADHHPDIDLRYGFVELRLLSHDVGRVTERDLGLAAEISRVAAQLSVTAQPTLAEDPG